MKNALNWLHNIADRSTLVIIINKEFLFNTQSSTILVVIFNDLWIIFSHLAPFTVTSILVYIYLGIPCLTTREFVIYGK